MLTTKHYIFSIILYLIFLYGWFISSLGPLIPHFSQATGLDETQYSYLFLVRSLANILGAIITKKIILKYNTKYLFNSLLITLILSFIFASYSLSTINLTINIFLASTALISSLIFIYSFIAKIFQNQHYDYWLQLLGLSFGIGAMCGPFLVAYFQLQTFKALGFAHILPILLLHKFQLPNLDESNTNVQSRYEMRLSKKSVLLISVTFFFFATQELGVASWISTYSTKAEVADVESSAIFSSLFWIPNCFCRLIWMYIPGKVEYRLRLALKGALLSGFITLLLQQGGYYYAVCIFFPISSGVFISAIYGFIVALPVDKGFTTTSQDNSNIILGNSFGEGLLIMPFGYSMGVFGFKVLIFEVFTFCCINYWTFNLSIQSMEEDRSKYEQSLLWKEIK